MGINGKAKKVLQCQTGHSFPDGSDINSVAKNFKERKPVTAKRQHRASVVPTKRQFRDDMMRTIYIASVSAIVSLAVVVVALKRERLLTARLIWRSHGYNRTNEEIAREIGYAEWGLGQERTTHD